MPDTEFVERLVSLIDRERLPETADVLRVRELSEQENEQRLDRLVSMCAQVSGENWRQREITRANGRVIMRMPSQARAVAHAVSGSMQVNRGFAPMDQLIGADDHDEALTGAVRELSERLHLNGYVGQGESLEFEKLWRIKACAADREGHSVDPVLCRAVGAFRHVVGGLPVWGAASAVVSAAARGQFDKVEVHARQAVHGPVDRVKVLPPEEAAVFVLRQLSGLTPGGEREFGDQARPVSFQFGYFALGKRKSQPYLAPAYVAMVEVRGEGEGQSEGRVGHVAVVSGAEKDYLQFARTGVEPQGNGHRNST